MVEERKVAYTYTTGVFILKKKGNSNTCHNMDETWHYDKWNKPDTKNKVCDSNYMKYLEQGNS